MKGYAALRMSGFWQLVDFLNPKPESPNSLEVQGLGSYRRLTHVSAKCCVGTSCLGLRSGDGGVGCEA